MTAAKKRYNGGYLANTRFAGELAPSVAKELESKRRMRGLCGCGRPFLVAQLKPESAILTCHHCHVQVATTRGTSLYRMARDVLQKTHS